MNWNRHNLKKNRFRSLFNFQMIIKNVIKVTIKRFSNSEKARSEKVLFRTWKWFSDIGNYVLVISFYDDCLSEKMKFVSIELNVTLRNFFNDLTISQKLFISAAYRISMVFILFNTSNTCVTLTLNQNRIKVTK